MNSPSQTEEPHVLYDAGRYAEAFPIYKDWASRGSIEALVLVGWMYQNAFGTDRNIEAAKDAYRRAAEMGSQEALYRLGVLSRQHDKLHDALKYFELAAEKGYSPALYRLGRMHQLGKGVQRDVGKALVYFNEAAAKGHVFGLRYYAALLLRGAQGPLGRIKGIGLFVKALVLGIKLGLQNPSSERLLE